MENRDEVKISGVGRPKKAVHCVLRVNDDTIRFAAKVATTVIWQMYGDERLCVDKHDVEEVNAVSLKAAVMKAIDGNCSIPKVIKIPAYFDYIIKGLQVNIGRYTVIADLETTECEVPASYRETMALMQACGITFVKPHQPNEVYSETLKLNIECCDGVDCITGNLSQLDLTDVIRRAFITMEEAETAKLKALTGELEFNYGEVDDVLTNHVSAQVRTAIK
jgi:hypothetical protein